MKKLILTLCLTGTMLLGHAGNAEAGPLRNLIRKIARPFQTPPNPVLNTLSAVKGVLTCTGGSCVSK